MASTASTGTRGTNDMSTASTGALARTAAASDTGISSPMNACRNGMARV
jgi:hypothetical protein